MNAKRFDWLVQKRTEQIVQVLSNKAKEYVADDDRLHHFKMAARIANCTPEKALRGMMLKHEVSVMDIINNLDKEIVPSIELVNEKLGDFINYLVLLETLLKERIESNE